MAAASSGGSAGGRWFMCTDCKKPFQEDKPGPFIGICAYCERPVVFQEKGARELYEMQQQESDEEEKERGGYRFPSQA